MRSHKHCEALGRRMATRSLTFAALLALSACGGGPQAPNKTPARKTELPAGLFVDQAPEGAREVVAAKKDFKPGEPIVVRGRIGGEQPFVKGRAAMTIYDVALPACNENPSDTCPKPWDYCCETKETRIANAAAVQVTGPDGKVLAADLEGANELGPLDVVVVKGTPAPGSQGGVLIVNAQAIYIEKRGNRKAGSK